jgi:hypothetical protein
MTRPTLAALLFASAAALAPPARADTANFELSGKLYTKYMYKNDDSQGCLSLSNPFWVDNIGGNNGACTEFELGIRARVGPRVTAGVRLQSRWGMIWQDWWENGDLKADVHDTSGESLGMNHAAYIKLRGAFVRVAPPIPTVRWVTIGATDYSMWNEWTIGKARYIDRDNGSGVFVEGEAMTDRRLSYTVGAMALPKLWAGPGWNTGIPGDPNGGGGDPLASLYATDWAFAAKLDGRLGDTLRLRAIGSWIQDWEADRYDPSLTGAPDEARDADHNVAWTTRFRGINGALDAVYQPSSLDWLSVSALLGASSNYVDPGYATNLVLNGQGFSPVVFRQDGAGRAIASNGMAGKLLIELFDPLQTGLSAKVEYFNIGEEYNAVMGARREADVLLTDGIITGGFTRGGQLPTLNVANEFVDWDEPWYETVIGWHGATGLLEWVRGALKASVEGTFITYNTNMQGRDVQEQFPSFLYTHGFTDTTAYTADADYANVHDRGKDPRSVYARDQDRRTMLAVLSLQYLLPRSVVVGAKLKYVDDRDDRKAPYDYAIPTTATVARVVPDDDYRGKAYLALGTVTLQPTNELKVLAGYELAYWDEARRTGTPTEEPICDLDTLTCAEPPYYDVTTRRHTVRGGLSYAFGGALLTYTLEYFHKDLLRDARDNFDMTWNVWRSKATFEVAW